VRATTRIDIAAVLYLKL